MNYHECKTYVSVDIPKEAKVEEIAKALKEALGVEPIYKHNYFVIGLNEVYDVNVNQMIRITLKDLLGKEDKIIVLQNMYSLTTTLEIVPQIVSNSDIPKQILSLDRDILAFLYKSNTIMDLDYYII